MKASIFIQTALIDQMQQIADLGLWFHLAKLLPSGVEVLARVTERNGNEGYLLSEKNAENLAIPDYLPVSDFYRKYFPPEYYDRSIQNAGTGFFSGAAPRIWLTSDSEAADMHLQFVGEKKHMTVRPCVLHVPAWFEDFKIACEIVLNEIRVGRIEDIEVLKTNEE